MDNNDSFVGFLVIIAIIALVVLCGIFGPLGILLWLGGIASLIFG